MFINSLTSSSIISIKHDHQPVHLQSRMNDMSLYFISWTSSCLKFKLREWSTQVMLASSTHHQLRLNINSLSKSSSSTHWASTSLPSKVHCMSRSWLFSCFSFKVVLGKFSLQRPSLEQPISLILNSDCWATHPLLACLTSLNSTRYEFIHIST